MEKYFTTGEGETVALGERLALRLFPGDVVALYGELGSGKTRMIKGICNRLGVREHVASPTFTILNQYTNGSLKICHFDFYRLQSPADIRDIGFDEFVNGECICLIEWADRVLDALPPKRYDVHLMLGNDESTREISIEEIFEVPA